MSSLSEDKQFLAGELHELAQWLRTRPMNRHHACAILVAAAGQLVGADQIPSDELSRRLDLLAVSLRRHAGVFYAPGDVPRH
ncbi:MAG: hypothetical protein L0H73_12525 [Nitrococcus sp.]|nr:hypothetical protein [Nitrococcus sp.]